MNASSGTLCPDLPGPAELARLVDNVRAGRAEAFVGTGDPDTVLACAHGSWRLGDILPEQDAASPATCAGTRKDGEPCQAPPKADSGYCVAHQDQDGG